MRVLTVTEISRMQTTQQGSLHETVVVQRYSSVADSYGNPTPTYTDQAAISGGLRFMTPREVQRTGEVPIIDAELRLPISTVLDDRDRIKITHRYGTALAIVWVFELVAPPKRGPSGLVCQLRWVTDGTG